MNVKKMYESTLNNLIEKYQAKREPLVNKKLFLFENIGENELLFIGINPSEIKNHEGTECINNIYWGNDIFKNQHPYYKLFDEIAECKWSHLDLYFTLEKSQKEIEKVIKKENLFLNEQLKISKEIIQKVTPKIIVVGNALASSLIQENFNCDFDKTIGTYKIKELNNIPIFFSGMFTGQRALDTGSRKRLIWHIGFVKEKLNIR